MQRLVKSIITGQYQIERHVQNQAIQDQLDRYVHYIQLYLLLLLFNRISDEKYWRRYNMEHD